MPEFGLQSKNKLELCDPDLQMVANEAIKHMDFTIIWGFRDKADQNKAYATGKSELPWPNSKHNHRTKRLVDDELQMVPDSLAIDVAPWPVDWKDTERFCILIGVFMACASILKVPLRFGRDFKKLKDYGHIELDL